MGQQPNIAVCKSYTMVYPPVQGDNSGALASGLSPLQVDKLCYKYFYTTLISVDLSQYELFCAKL